jgi:hypothetical protein
MQADDLLGESLALAQEAAPDQFAGVFGPRRGGGQRACVSGTYALAGSDDWYAWDMTATVAAEGSSEEGDVATVTFQDSDGKLVGTVTLGYAYGLMGQRSGTSLPGGIVPAGAIRQLQASIG